MLSSLYPWNGPSAEFGGVVPTSGPSMDSIDIMEEEANAAGGAGVLSMKTTRSSEVSAWIDLHLSMNDILYPVSMTPNYGLIACSPTARDLNVSHISINTNSHSMYYGEIMPSADAPNSLLVDPTTGSPSLLANSKISSGPSKFLTPVAALSRFFPTVINGCSTTVLHAVTTGATRHSARKGKYRRRRGNSNATAADDSDSNSVQSGENLGGGDISDQIGRSASIDDAMSLDDDGMRSVMSIDDSMLDESGKFDFGNDPNFKESFLNANNNSLSSSCRLESLLPQLFLNYSNGASIYLISPYYSASINGCSNCEIVIGAVHGAIVINGCENIKLTCACRKLIVLNCLDCEFNVACLGPIVISGDSRGLVFGKLVAEVDIIDNIMY